MPVIIEDKYCHHCHTRRPCVRCSNPKCSKGYCANCIDKYGTSMDLIATGDAWECFGCSNNCLCAQCRKRGKTCAEPLTAPIHPRMVELLTESAKQEGKMNMNGPLEVLCPNPRAKPFVPSRMDTSSSPFRGVSAQGLRWRARICIDKVELTIGDFDTEEEAAKAYDLESIRRGKLRNLNFVYRNVNEELMPEVHALFAQGVVGGPMPHVVATSTRGNKTSASSGSGARGGAGGGSGAGAKPRPAGGASARGVGGGGAVGMGGAAFMPGAPHGMMPAGMMGVGGGGPGVPGAPHGLVTAFAPSVMAKAAAVVASMPPGASYVGSGEDGFDDFCFFCGANGDLIICDSCPRVFHAQCLQVTEVPDGPFQCPICVHQRMMLPAIHMGHATALANMMGAGGMGLVPGMGGMMLPAANPSMYMGMMGAARGGPGGSGGVVAPAVAAGPDGGGGDGMVGRKQPGRRPAHGRGSKAKRFRGDDDEKGDEDGTAYQDDEDDEDYSDHRSKKRRPQAGDDTGMPPPRRKEDDGPGPGGGGSSTGGGARDGNGGDYAHDGGDGGGAGQGAPGNNSYSSGGGGGGGLSYDISGAPQPTSPLMAPTPPLIVMQPPPPPTSGEVMDTAAASSECSDAMAEALAPVAGAEGSRSSRPRRGARKVTDSEFYHNDEAAAALDRAVHEWELVAYEDEKRQRMVALAGSVKALLEERLTPGLSEGGEGGDEPAHPAGAGEAAHHHSRNSEAIAVSDTVLQAQRMLQASFQSSLAPLPSSLEPIVAAVSATARLQPVAPKRAGVGNSTPAPPPPFPSTTSGGRRTSSMDGDGGGPTNLSPLRHGLGSLPEPPLSMGPMATPAPARVPGGSVDVLPPHITPVPEAELEDGRIAAVLAADGARVAPTTPLGELVAVLGDGVRRALEFIISPAAREAMTAVQRGQFKAMVAGGGAQTHVRLLAAIRKFQGDKDVVSLVRETSIMHYHWTLATMMQGDGNSTVAGTALGSTASTSPIDTALQSNAGPAVAVPISPMNAVRPGSQGRKSTHGGKPSLLDVEGYGAGGPTTLIANGSHGGASTSTPFMGAVAAAQAALLTAAGSGSMNPFTAAAAAYSAFPMAAAAAGLVLQSQYMKVGSPASGFSPGSGGNGGGGFGRVGRALASGNGGSSSKHKVSGQPRGHRPTTARRVGGGSHTVTSSEASDIARRMDLGPPIPLPDNHASTNANGRRYTSMSRLRGTARIGLPTRRASVTINQLPRVGGRSGARGGGGVGRLDADLLNAVANAVMQEEARGSGVLDEDGLFDGTDYEPDSARGISALLSMERDFEEGEGEEEGEDGGHEESEEEGEDGSGSVRGEGGNEVHEPTHPAATTAPDDGGRGAPAVSVA